MSVDTRARDAAAALHEAVAELEPPALPLEDRLRPDRGRLLSQRAAVAILVAVALVGGALVLRDQASDPSPGVTASTGGTDDPSGVRTDDDRDAGFPAPSGPGGSGGADPRDEPSEPGVQVPERGQRGDDGVKPSSCDPVMVDPRGDIDDPSVDILEGDLSYVASSNTLVIRHVMADIPVDPPPDDTMTYEFRFRLDGVTYLVKSYLGIWSYPNGSYTVNRAVRNPEENWPMGSQDLVMEPRGSINGHTDTVTIEIDLDAFNSGERSLSDREGLPPAAELRRGSELSSMTLSAHPTTTGGGPYDEPYDSARARCSFVVDDATP